jgi:hypothetical protein
LRHPKPPAREARATGLLPLWALPLYEARQALLRKDLDRADGNIQAALAQGNQASLVGLTHLLILRQKNEVPLLAIAQHYHQQWPECLQFIIILAEALLEKDRTTEGVALLHQAVARDVAGQTARRLFGEGHPYLALWPAELKAVVDVPIPAGVAAALGWNLLPGPTPGEQANPGAAQGVLSTQAGQPPQTPETGRADGGLHTAPAAVSSPQKPLPALPKVEIPETLKAVQAELEKTAARLKMDELARSDGRFPIYVVFTTRQGLQKKYGRATTALLDDAMKKLAAALRQRLDWGATLLYADDPASMAEFGLKPARAEDAWELKLALADLDLALGRQGAMIGAVLIVGGPEVVPFHHLPNPTDDADADVPSDNPYATRDENYFVPEWPVGRLPGGAGNDPGLLISMLRAMAGRYAATSQPAAGWFSLWRDWLRSWLRPTRRQTRKNFGYSAEIWQRASLSVFRPIGEARALVTSPPASASQVAPIEGRLGYFNLHGLPDTAEWYGQRDLVSSENTAQQNAEYDYPVALRPQDVINDGHAPQVVFSEACYGAHIIGKSIEQALALKFLAAGSEALIGSTVMSYGSIATPLNAADLLGKAFWNHFKEGLPAGEALRRAKIYLAREMHHRQGYLDGEDQKTLISFVLYGDPLALYTGDSLGLARPRHKSILRPRIPSPIKTVCDRTKVPGSSDPIPAEMLGQVRQIVEQYLPGMKGAQLTLSHEHEACCCKEHHCPTRQFGAKMAPTAPPERQVITLRKSIQRARHTHQAYARLTFDRDGKVVKLAISR